MFFFKDILDRLQTILFSILSLPVQQSAYLLVFTNDYYVREDINTKKTFSLGHCPNHLNPPLLTPIRATWSFFSDVKIEDLKVT